VGFVGKGLASLVVFVFSSFVKSVLSGGFGVK
jgi:hypothetical protein